MPQPAWMIDELAHAGPEHLDLDYVPGYDAKSQTDPGEDLAPLRSIRPEGWQTVVDLGAGTGTFALAVAPESERVVAVDVSPPMLAALRRKVADANLGNVETVLAGFLSYEHQGAPADLVYTRHALHHLPDVFKVIALQRISAMMAPGGVLCLRDLVYSFDPADAGASFERWVSGGQADPALGWTRSELETHVREEFSTFSWLLEPMLERAGFTITDAQHGGSIYARYICVKR